MIIRDAGASQLLITQPDHAELSAAIMAAWRADGFEAHARRDVILRAVRDHDNGWIEEDAATIVGGDGRPVDFVAAPIEVKHRIWPRAVARVGARDRYEAALIAQHALTVHAQHRADDRWGRFFARMEGARDAMLGRPADEVFVRDYRFVRIGDLLSLVFCNGWTERHDLPGGGRTILKGATLEVSPDPFAGARVPLRVSARRIPSRAYLSAAELRFVLADASTETIEGTAVGLAA
jgi:hypothetical protein